MCSKEAGTIANDITVYEQLSKHREELMGLSILWVVLFHFPIECTGVLKYMQLLGYGGVDIFLLLSGMGIYTSLSRNSVTTYIRNRLLRIVPSWWLYLLVYTILKKYILRWEISPKGIVAAALFSGYWTGLPDQGNWYVYMIILLYISAPFFYLLLSESKRRKKNLLLILGISFLISLSFSFAGEKWLMPFSRVPIFVLGMYIASDKEVIKIVKNTYFLCGLISALGVVTEILLYTRLGEQKMYEYGLWWYPFFFIAPSITILVSVIFERAGRTIIPVRVLLRLLGRASLEVLLVSEFCFVYYSDSCNPGLLTALAIGIAVMVQKILDATKKVFVHD